MLGERQDPLMISALEHYAYCPRQCALIHMEQVWSENLYTMRGKDVHQNVDTDSSHDVAGIRYERALPIWCRRLNLVGRADMVEFHGDVPYPVEYKSGRRKRGAPETLQLCAQAICLEEMTGVAVPEGALFWHGSRERVEVELSEAMRLRVEGIAAEVQAMLKGTTLPAPSNDARCRECSLKGSCLPGVVGEKARLAVAAAALFDR